MFELLGVTPDYSISSSLQCADCFRKIWDSEMMEFTEMVYVIYLNRKREPIYFKLLNIGTYSDSHIDLRRALYYALSKHSNHIIIAHNHTSGIANPSKKDIEQTERIQLLCDGLEINFVDHIIMTVDGYYSFKDSGLL